MIKLIALILFIALGALLAYAATRPDTFAVQRSTVIQAPAEQVHALIHNLHRFNTWNPYNFKDPNMVLTYRGPEAGPGAAFDFKGNKEVGQGSIEITASAPHKVSMRLTMTSPFACLNAIDFLIEPKGQASQVTWAMNGPNNYLGKVMGVIFNMDRMVGRDFETGLAKLKTIAETH